MGEDSVSQGAFRTSHVALPLSLKSCQRNTDPSCVSTDIHSSADCSGHSLPTRSLTASLLMASTLNAQPVARHFMLEYGVTFPSGMSFQLFNYLLNDSENLPQQPQHIKVGNC